MDKKEQIEEIEDILYQEMIQHTTTEEKHHLLHGLYWKTSLLRGKEITDKTFEEIRTEIVERMKKEGIMK